MLLTYLPIKITTLPVAVSYQRKLKHPVEHQLAIWTQFCQLITIGTGACKQCHMVQVCVYSR